MTFASRNASFRAVLIGLSAFLLSVVLAAVFGFQSFVFGLAIVIESLVLAILAATISDGRPWLQGLLAGLGLCVPGLILVFSVHRPRPSPGAWFICAFVLLVSSSGAQSVALWRGRRWLAGFLVLLGAIVLIGMGREIARLMFPFVPIHAHVDQPLPAFTFTTLDGKPIPVTAFQSYVTVIDFWGTWCTPCIAEMPSLNSVYSEYAPNPKVRFLLVNSELGGDNPEKIRSFLRRNPISIPMALDPDQSYFKLDINGLPLVVVVDQRGHIRYEDTGYATGEATKLRLHDEIDTLLAGN